MSQLGRERGGFAVVEGGARRVVLEEGLRLHGHQLHDVAGGVLLREAVKVEGRGVVLRVHVVTRLVIAWDRSEAMHRGNDVARLVIGNWVIRKKLFLK